MEQKKPTISIIIPSYNQAKYLKDSIESALNQTVKAHEIIVVDDGSPDNSLGLAQAYEDLGVKVISQINKGLPAARNTGIMNATGDYVLPLDADDILKENAVEKITEVAKKTKADIVSGSLKCFGLSEQEIILMENPTIEDFKVANRVGYCSAVKREVLLEVGGYSPKMIFGYEDLSLWFDLLSRGKKLVTIPEVLWLYRVKEKSMIHDAMSHHVELMTQIAKDFPKIFPEVTEINTPLPK
jgi:glycosyltransferase involved in cell wall biosynthesis